MEFRHPSYYKKLRDLRRQASGNGRVGPQATSSKKNKSLDRSEDMGYSGNSDQGSDRATRPGMEPAAKSTVKKPGSRWEPGAAG